jgi:hypothetical protein
VPPPGAVVMFAHAGPAQMQQCRHAGGGAAPTSSTWPAGRGGAWVRLT